MAKVECFNPGTEILLEVASRAGGHDTGRLAHLQLAKQGEGHILLVPQPSLSDPNDPLRWTRPKKWLTLLNGLCYSFNGSVTGPIMAAELFLHFDTPFQRVTYTNGATLVCQGVVTCLWMPFAVKYGRRPVYLLSNLLMMVACIWLGSASTGTYTSFLLGRAFLGIFEAPIESIVPSTVTDLFFLHERNDGIREPEMRLPTCIIAAVITLVGAVITGVTYHQKTHWSGPVIGYGIFSAGAQMGTTLAMTYSLDCHKEMSVELMVTIASVKSKIAWIWTWVINEWIIASGAMIVFFIIGAVNVAVYATTVPM